MRIMLGLLVLVVWALGACGPSDRSGDDPDGGVTYPDAEPKLPVGEHHQYVVDSVTMPTTDAEGQMLGLDVDGDGDVDNRLAVIDQLLATGGADVNENLRFEIDRGEVIHLADLQASSLDTAGASALYVWMGQNPVPAPCLDASDQTCRRHLLGTGHFDVANAAPVDAMVFGRMSGGHYSGARGVVTLEIPLLLSDTPLTLEIIEARAEVDVSPTALSNGHLAGAITQTYLHDRVLPQLQENFAVEIAGDCLGVAPDCCIPDTNGAQLVGLFDADSDCRVSVQELEDSSVLSSVLAPDVDLLDSEGLAGRDGVKDSLSVGVGFTAVPATYPLPPGLP